jgi:hypothetical protein
MAMVGSKSIWLMGVSMLSLSLIASEAHAAVQILAESGDSIELLDLNTIKRTGGQRNIVMTTIYAVAKALPNTGGKTYQSAHASALLDCRKNQYAMQKMELFDPAGKLLGSKQFPSMNWKPVKPGFPIASAAATACGKRDRKAQIRDSMDIARKEYLDRTGKSQSGAETAPPVPNKPTKPVRAKRKRAGSVTAISPKEQDPASAVPSKQPNSNTAVSPK